MADVYTYVVPSGTIVVDTDTIKTEVNAEFQQAFGDDLDVQPNSPEGVLITGEVLSRAAAADNNVAVANQINPNIAGGVYLDAIGALTNTQRTPATFTTVACNLTGVPGTIVPIGSQAKDTNGNVYASLAAVTLAPDGTGSVTFQSLVSGPITVAPASLTTIVSVVLGWETVTNPTQQATTGTAIESDAAFRQRRRQELALQGTALPEAIISGLYALNDVTSVFYQENISPSTMTINGVSMIGHSIYVVVTGGDNVDIANVLLNKKAAGAAYNNGAGVPITVPLIVPFSGQNMNILFDRPAVVQINVIVNISAGSVLSDPTTAVKQAIADYQAGNLPNSASGLGIGVAVSAFEIAGAITLEYPGIFVQSVLIAYAPTVPTSSAVLPIAVFQQANIDPSAIAVNIS